MMKMSRYLIDVSEHNGSINLMQAKESISGIIARSSWGWGSDQIDKEWCNNAKQANQYGLPLYAYHYCYARNEEEALSEAKLAISACKGYQVNVIYYDMEYSDFQTNLSANQYYNIAKTFCDYIERNGYAAGIYANEDWFRHKLINVGFSKWTLWIANYGANDGNNHWNGQVKFNPFGNVLIHQFTSNAKAGVLKGIKGIPSTGLDGSLDHGLLDTFNGNKITISDIFNMKDSVKIKKSSKWYDGQIIPDFVYNRNYTIMEIIKDSVVIGIDGKVTGAININNLYK